MLPDASKAGSRAGPRGGEQSAGAPTATLAVPAASGGGSKKKTHAWMAPLLLLFLALQMPPSNSNRQQQHVRLAAGNVYGSLAGAAKVGMHAEELLDEWALFPWRKSQAPPLHHRWREPTEAHMLMTERQRRGGNVARRSPSPLPSTSASPVETQRAVPHSDPSLMDYEAIDVYWRRDIELEKNEPQLHQYYGQPWVDGAFRGGSPMDTTLGNDEQFERDLQVLTEKSMLTPLRFEQQDALHADWQQLYEYEGEDLSKAHFSDFYRAAASDEGFDLPPADPYLAKDPFAALADQQAADVELPTGSGACSDPFAASAPLIFPFDLDDAGGEEHQVVVVGGEGAHPADVAEDELDCFAFNDFFDLPASFDAGEQTLQSSRRASPSSSGIGSSMSSSSGSCSPRSYRHSEEPCCSRSASSASSLSSRFYDKLAPRPAADEAPRKRGRQSRDSQLVADNGLPASAEQLTAMSHQQIQRLLRDPAMTPQRRALIKKIRRRGRNKEAARKCRERRTSRLAPVEEAAEEQKPTSSKKA